MVLRIVYAFMVDGYRASDTAPCNRLAMYMCKVLLAIRRLCMNVDVVVAVVIVANAYVHVYVLT